MISRWLNQFRLWLLEEYCKNNSVVIISHVGGKMRSTRYKLTDDQEKDRQNIKNLGATASRTVSAMMRDEDVKGEKRAWKWA